MNLWFTRPDAKITRTFVKRFDPLHWTVDFPRGSIASLVTTTLYWVKSFGPSASLSWTLKLP